MLMPQLSTLPEAQRRLWPELGSVPAAFALYGGTALALRIAHRRSDDFVAEHDQVQGMNLSVASLLDIAGSKAAVIQKRAEARDYIDIDALMRNGVDLPTVLAAGRAMYGGQFNPLVTLKALSYFDDVPALAQDVRARLSAAVRAVELSDLPVMQPLRQPAQPDGNGV
ncbi:MAG: nucleotidyl transferase AbiEii/AbiGii toxin family protein [Gammaproteobacteria bacterium]|nr:nucleotidyl transferase AbiEii/AbiGii toxin family protein [Gammaproteobacteria bacterium]